MLRHLARQRRNLGPIRHGAIGLAAPLLALLILFGLASSAGAQDPTEGDQPTTSAAFTGPATSANARFVVEAYQTLLSRDPDTSGLDFHLSRLVAGGASSRFAVTYALVFSVEGSRGEVERAYGDLLGRAADATGLAYWTNHLQGHGVVDLRVLLLAGAEYRNRAGGTDQAWIEALYRDVLGRPADAPGLAYWLDQAGSGVDRALIAAAIYQSDEALGQRAVAYYQEVLSRTPSSTERLGAVATIRRIGERGLRAELLASDEAFEAHLQAALS